MIKAEQARELLRKRKEEALIEKTKIIEKYIPKVDEKILSTIEAEKNQAEFYLPTYNNPNKEEEIQSMFNYLIQNGYDIINGIGTASGYAISFKWN